MVDKLSFAGGDVAIPKPTRSDLVESIGDWAHVVKDHASKIHSEALGGEFDTSRLVALKSAVGLLENAVRELEAAK
jgi:hypothetical protein